MKKIILYPVLTSLVLVMTACSDGSGSSAGRGGALDGELTVKITDAPVDDATAVVVTFTGVTLKPADGEAIEFIFDNPKSINLLALQSGKTEFLLEDVRVPAGKYNWMRVHVNAERDTDYDSYIEIAGGMYELGIPSGEERGLQIINDIEVESNGDLNLVIDFDLRKSVVVQGNGDYDLKPVLRMVDLDNYGSIEGVIDADLLTTVDCNDSKAIYVYEGFDATPDDIDGDKGDPVASSNVGQNFSSLNYEYLVSFLEPGDYTIALTCQADLDQADNDDLIQFIMTHNISVVKHDDVVRVLR